MKLFQKEKANALLQFLEYAHAEQYSGLDDEMADDCNEWISSLSDDEVSELVLAAFREGL